MSRAPAPVPPPQQLPLFEPVSSRAAGPATTSDTGISAPRSGSSLPTGGPLLEIFRHPQADREILLREHVVAYALRRARRRSIGFVVGVEGLSVNAPKWVGQNDIELALHEKSGWILRKLQEQRDRARRMQAARVDWRDGASIPFLGDRVVVVLDPSTKGVFLDAGSACAPCVKTKLLRVGLPKTASAEQIRDAVQSWLQRQAKALFEERCAHYSELLGVRVVRLSLSSAQTRWGSASADGSIRLNWRLVHFALPSVDYVVAHELAHLREMNHSPKFWDVVRSVMPDYEQARGSLKDGLVPLLD